MLDLYIYTYITYIHHNIAALAPAAVEEDDEMLQMFEEKVMYVCVCIYSCIYNAVVLAAVEEDTYAHTCTGRRNARGEGTYMYVYLLLKEYIYIYMQMYL